MGLCTVLLAIVLVFAVSLSLPEDNGRRYIQHMDAPEKAPCAAHDASTLCSHLPILRIYTGGVEIPGQPVYDANGSFVEYTTAGDGSTAIHASLGVIDHETENNHLNDAATLVSDITIRLRGHSSRLFDKPNYYIQLIHPDGTNNRQPLLGMDAHHEWALHGPFLDKTLLRNYMWYNLAGLVMEYSPNVRFCELIVDGKYEGVYLLTETITAGKDGARLPLSVRKKDNHFSGYAIRLDWGDSQSGQLFYPFTNYGQIAETQHEIVYPGKANMTSELHESIKDDFSAFEKALYSYDFDNKQYGHPALIEMDSFVDYFLINEISCNYDAGYLSTFMYKDMTGKYHMCVWDFNSACDLYPDGAMDTEDFQIQYALWFTMLFKDQAFTDRVIERYYQLREDVFSDEYLESFIDSTIAYLGDAIGRNNERWGYSFYPEQDLLTPRERNLRSYEAYVQQLKDFLEKRLAFMDENIETLRQYSAESKVKKYTEFAG